MYLAPFTNKYIQFWFHKLYFMQSLITPEQFPTSQLCFSHFKFAFFLLMFICWFLFRPLPLSHSHSLSLSLLLFLLLSPSLSGRNSCETKRTEERMNNNKIMTTRLLEKIKPIRKWNGNPS